MSDNFLPPRFSPVTEPTYTNERITRLWAQDAEPQDELIFRFVRPVDAQPPFALDVPVTVDHTQPEYSQLGLLLLHDADPDIAVVTMDYNDHGILVGHIATGDVEVGYLLGSTDPTDSDIAQLMTNERPTDFGILPSPFHPSMMPP